MIQTELLFSTTRQAEGFPRKLGENNLTEELCDYPFVSQVRQMAETEAEKNRKKYPEIAKLVDEVRKYFPDAKVISITQSQANPKSNVKDD